MIFLLPFRKSGRVSFLFNHMRSRVGHIVLVAMLPLWCLGQGPERGAGGLPLDAEAFTSIPSEYPFVLPKGVKLPSKVDLAEWFPPAGDQFRQASCSGWALGYGLTSYQSRRAEGVRMDRSGVVPNDPVFSPSFLYDQLLLMQDRSDCSVGVALYDAVLLACNAGCCTFNYFPFDSAARDCLRPIPDSARVQAANYRMDRPLSLDARNVDQWKYHLSQGKPIVFTASIDSTFDQGFLTQAGSSFTWNMPAPKDWNGRVHHIMVCTGYDDTDSSFIVLNSWGTNWGSNGYGRISYNTMDWTCSEAYVTERLVESPQPLIDDTPDWKEPSAKGRIRGKLDGTELHSTDDLAWRALDMDRDAGNILVEFSDPELEGMLRTVKARKDQPTTFFHEGTYYTFTFSGHSWLRGRQRYSMILNDPRLEEYRRSIRERIAEREGRSNRK